MVAVLTDADMPRLGDGQPPAVQTSYPAEAARAAVAVEIEHAPVTLLGDSNREDPPVTCPIGKPVAIGDVDTAVTASAHPRPT